MCLSYRDITVGKFPLYYLASDTTEAEIHNDKLVLFHENVMFDTDETATKINDKWIIQQSNLRLNHEVLDELERWTSEDWIRRKGYLPGTPNGIQIQLREKIEVVNKFEVEFYEFSKINKMKWIEKPKWGR